MSYIALRTALPLAIAVASFTAGWAVEGWRMAGEVERLKATQATGQAGAAAAVAQRLADAQAKNDTLAAQVADTENRLTQALQEKADAIRQVTTGRRCLDAAAVRVLNGASDQAAGAVPEAGGGAVPADGAFATDTDVGAWIAGCQQQYDTCRGRLGAIADFFRGFNE